MRKSAHPPRKARPSVLLVAPEGRHRSTLQSILQEAGCRTFICARHRDAADLIPFASVVITEHSLPDGCWRDLLQAAGELSRAPAVIVTARQADGALRREVLQAGGFDLLAPPFRAAQVLEAVTGAHRRRPARREDGAFRPSAIRQGRVLAAGVG